MKLQNLIVIFIIIVLPIVLIMSLYISNGLKTVEYQSLYDNGLVNASHDALYAFELNTANDELSENPEVKRDILKASIKMFEKSLCNTYNISSYNTDEIEEYIPAIVFGMYDGFYMYAPSYNSITGKYEHSLKNFVYYSETLTGAGHDNTDIIITYSLDNYITVCGDFGAKDDAGNFIGYEVKKGYLQCIDDSNSNQYDGKEYMGVPITTEKIDGKTNTEAQQYYNAAFSFSYWFLNDSGVDWPDYLKINDENNPEDEESAFVMHKRKIIKEKIEGVLNSTITAYSQRTWGQNYKMPELSEEDWQKIYSNISMISFFQGKQIGFTKYNGYTVVNSTNSREYVNPSLMYFISEGEYHDIRCIILKDYEEVEENSSTLIGYRIGSFESRKVEEEKEVTNDDGTTSTTTETKYEYDHDELACYECVNGSLSTSDSIYGYINPIKGVASDNIKTAYWTSLGRERYDPTKITPIDLEIDVKFDINGGNTGSIELARYSTTYEHSDSIRFPNRDYSLNELKTQFTKTGHNFLGWNTSETATTPLSEDEMNNAKASTDVTYYAVWEPIKYQITYVWWEGEDDTVLELEYGSNPFNYSYSLIKKEQTGYELVGWEKVESGTRVSVNTETEKVTGETKYYAQWKIKTYTIIFEYNDGTGRTSVAENVDNGSSIPFPNVSRTKYELIGWSEDPSATTGTTNAIATENATYYAIWKEIYTITFAYNNGTDALETKELVEGTAIQFPDSTSISYTGHTLSGWSKDLEGNQMVDTANQIAEGNTTYYAQWRENEYTIEFMYNEGKDTSGNNSSSAKVKHGDTISFPENITREGYTFNGWSTDKEAESGITSETAIGEYDGQVITYYAIWKTNTLTVNYYSNYATSCTINVNSEHGKATGNDVRGDVNTHVYTYVWTSNLTGEGHTLHNFTTSGSSIYLTRTGYTATGYWITETGVSAHQGPTYTVEGLANALGTTLKDGSKTINVYAGWTENTYTIAFNANGGSGSMSSLTNVKYTESKTLTANTFTRTGYTFNGWNTKADGTGTSHPDRARVSRLATGGTVTLYAQWTQIPKPAAIPGDQEVSVSIVSAEGIVGGIFTTNSIRYNLTITLNNELATNVTSYTINFGDLKETINGSTGTVSFNGITMSTTGGGDTINKSIKIIANNNTGSTDLGTKTIWIRGRCYGEFGILVYHGAGVFNYDPQGLFTGGEAGNVWPHKYPSTTLNY